MEEEQSIVADCAIVSTWGQFREHWNSFIVEDDFKFIATSGLNVVRIAVVLDVAVSFEKVIDVDWNLGNENSAIDGFQEAIDMLETLTLKSKANGLKQRLVLAVRK
ncbi:protein NCA1-like [Senna tora]|uniref:Protein NCA1-like n=1 Tax=Senna tora TaxID=362788 RepID=A0A834T1L4_9FABA|nr:protein NCA1-like [Senna tora]